MKGQGSYRILKFIRSTCRRQVALLDICKYIFEIKKRNFPDYLNAKTNQYRQKAYNSGAIDSDLGIVLYGITRALKPNVILETGCGWGISSAYFLYALAENGNGKLITIEYPRFENEINPADYPIEDRGGIIPPGRQPGWVIPDNLRNRWELVLGKSSEKLSPTLNKLNQIDIFFHDSLHTFENMHFEYQSTWPFIRKGGIMLSHNINLNSAFSDFAKGLHSTYSFIQSGPLTDPLGGIVKI